MIGLLPMVEIHASRKKDFEIISRMMTGKKYLTEAIDLIDTGKPAEK